VNTLARDWALVLIHSSDRTVSLCMHGDVLSGSDDTMTDRDTLDIDEIHGNGSSCADESASDLLTIECVNGISNMRRKPPSMVRSNIGKALRSLLCLISGSIVFILREKLPMLLLTLKMGLV